MGTRNRSPRRTGRERAFQILYGWNFIQPERETFVKRTLTHLFAEDEPSSSANTFAQELIEGVLEKREQLDQLIARFSKNWRIERIAYIELTILRLSLYEILYCQQVPMKVAINEGIELSKRYGDRKSRQFVNGLLDGVAKSMAEGGLPSSSLSSEQE
jgi:N utilization substance protein B